MPRPAASAVLAIAVAATASCGSAAPGQTQVRLEGTVSSLVTTTPEATTTTDPARSTTTTVPGVDPGGCPPPGETVTISLVEDIDLGRPCPVSTEGSLRFTNLTDQIVTLSWGADDLEVGPQQSFVPDGPVGEVLSPGLHAFETSLDEDPTVVVAAPEEAFGSSQVSLRSFGGIRPGQSVVEVEAAIGSPIVVGDRSAACTIGWVQGDAHSPFLQIDTTDGFEVLRVDATTESQRTLSGLGIGSTLGALRDAYGDQLAEIEPGDAALRYAFEPNEAADVNFRLVFDLKPADQTEEAIVVAMRIGRIPYVMPSERCAE